MILYNEKTPFQAIKTRSLKSGNIDKFPKGLTHGFGSKNSLFSNFFFSNNAQEKDFYDNLQQKNAFLGYKKKKFKKSKIDIFPKGLNHGFNPKMAIFPSFSFQAIWGRQMSFMIFQSDKTPFQGIKTRSSKSRKIDIFPKA